MNVAKKPAPVGVCKTCGGITYRRESINQRCGRSPRGQRCTGTISNASRPNMWKPCTACGATGKLDAGLCPYCRGIGWNLAKPWNF